LRIDKFLKLAKIVKRRGLAKLLCEHGRVLINDKTAKPSSQVKEGDIVKVIIRDRIYEYEVIDTCETKYVSEKRRRLLSISKYLYDEEADEHDGEDSNL
jgi:ribosomal 50S subunit-recycling heat shock protein